jgi:disulfide bond formation protein DsbB
MSDLAENKSSSPRHPRFIKGTYGPIIGGVAMPVITLLLLAGLWNLLDAHEVRRQQIALSKIVKVDHTAYARGQQLYAMACVACHGPEGKGVAGLGKDLLQSTFARNLSDAQLAAFITAGRGVDDPLNTSKVPMPAKGGRADFSDHNIADVVTYLRGLADPRRVPAGPLPQVEVVVGEPEASQAVAAAPAPAPATASPAASASVQLTAAAATPAGTTALTFDPQAAARGKKAFVSCMACHGKDGKGMPKMGKTLVASPFVNGHDDKSLVEFIKKGRGPTDPDNTTKVGMPPKGGNPALKDPQLQDIVAYIRSLNGATAAAAAPAPTPAPVAAAQPSLPTAAPVLVTAPVRSAAAPTPTVSKAPSSPTDIIARGKKAYVSCIACHGKDATGVKNMGKNLIESPFVAKLTDDALVDFIKKGRGPTDPDNTTKVGMPPKGGNPALKDEQIRDIVAYIRSLRQSSARTE